MTKIFNALESFRVAGRMAGLALLAVVFFGRAAIGRAQTPSQSFASASDAPTITYRRVFKGSTPEFVEVIVRQDGTATADVRQLSDAPSPEEFKMNAAWAQQIFDLARQLGNFQGADLNVQRRVAYMGDKTLRWDQGSETHQTQYNYTLDPKANQLQKMFDNLAQEQSDLSMLEERLRYDRLGVNQGLDQFEQHLSRGELPEPGRFLTVLDKIAEDTRLIEMARQRARSLAARIRVGQEK